MIVEFLELTFGRHDTCNLLCDTSLALARSSPTRRYTGINLNNYLTRVRLSVCSFVRLFVCLSVAKVPTWRHLQSGAAQTTASSRVKFAQFAEHELGHLHVEKRGRWGAR